MFKFGFRINGLFDSINFLYSLRKKLAVEDYSMVYQDSVRWPSVEFTQVSIDGITRVHRDDVLTFDTLRDKEQIEPKLREIIRDAAVT